jgi:N-acetylglucosaminyltransferase II (MGAT2)
MPSLVLSAVGHYYAIHGNFYPMFVLQINHVFDHLRITRYFSGLVLTLEEDHYVAPDILHVLRQMYRLRQRLLSLVD